MLIKNLFRANTESSVNTPNTSLSVPDGVLNVFSACVLHLSVSYNLF